MELYVVSDGVPEWNTGYLSWRLNKNGGTTSGDYLANVAGWSADSLCRLKADGARSPYRLRLSA